MLLLAVLLLQLLLLLNLLLSPFLLLLVLLLVLWQLLLLSTTVMVWKPTDVFPQSSVAVHALVMVPDVMVSTSSIVTSESQLFVADGTPVLAELESPEHSTVASAGTVISGAVLSTTVMVWSPEDTLPHSSVAVHVLVMTLMTLSCGQVVPASTESLSSIVVDVSAVAVATPVKTELESSSHSTVASSGKVISGAVVSMTLMVCSPSDVLPDSSWSSKTFRSPADARSMVSTVARRASRAMTLVMWYVAG